MNAIVRRLSAAILTLAAIGWGAVWAKDASVLVTAEMRARAVENAAKQPWARLIQAGAVKAAKRWLAMPDEELAAMVTSQELPRTCYTKAGILYAKKKPGCPNCGEKILRFGERWKCDPKAKPWKIICPSCGEVYPKNDFAAFYPTALDEHGMFRRERGDRSLLFNTEHPDPNDPLHNLYVDDGYGMRDERGDVHHPIAYYNDAVCWHEVPQALASLARAYTLTGDVRYAHKAAVLLDRIADVYPEMDYLPLHRLGFQHSHGGGGRGRVVGCIWECGFAQRLAEAYDWVYDGMRSDEQFMVYDARKSARWAVPRRKDPAEICRHVEDHLLREILLSCKDGRAAGNMGMTHVCEAVTALALDDPQETPQWLDWLFSPSFPGWGSNPGGVPWLMVQGIDADGMGGECGNYGLIWSGRSIDLAEVLAACPRYNRYDMVRLFPKLKQCFFIKDRLTCLDAAMPPIGDAGATGAWGRPGDALHFARGFNLYGDPRLAELAWRYADGKPGRLRRTSDVFEPEGGSLAARVAAAAKDQPLPPLKCEHLGRYGLAMLQTPRRENGRAVWIHFGYAKGHSHADALNLGLYAKNVDMLPDLGYPAYTGKFPERIAWTSNTASHNTLLVGDTRSRPTPGGKIRLLAVAPPLRAVDVECPATYAGTPLYRRQVLLIDVGDEDSYVLDVFRARGGTNHRLSWHGPAATATVQGVKLVKQARGSFAGPEIEPRKLDGPQAKALESSGFSYLYDVDRSAGPVPGVWTADWKAEDLRGRIHKGREPHLRIYGLTPCDELATASGDPPQNKGGNPRSLRYLIQSRLGKDQSSQFVNVLEPYDGRPYIRRVRTLKTEHAGEPDSVAAVAVEMENGTTDVAIVCREPLRVKVEGGIEFDGLLGLIRLVDGRVQSLRMANARSLKVGSQELLCRVPAYRGKVARIEAEDPKNHRVYLDPPLPAEADLVGRTIHFENDVPWDTSFDIADRGSDWISTGEISLLRGFKVAKDFKSGYAYTVNPDDGYVLPMTAALDCR